MTQGWRARPSPGAPAAPGAPTPRWDNTSHPRPQPGSDTDPGTAPAPTLPPTRRSPSVGSSATSPEPPPSPPQARGHRGARGVGQPCPALCPGRGFGVPVPGWRGLPATPRLSDSPRCRQLPARPHGRGTRLAAAASACSRAAEPGRPPTGMEKPPKFGVQLSRCHGGLGCAVEGAPGRKLRCRRSGRPKLKVCPPPAPRHGQGMPPAFPGRRPGRMGERRWWRGQIRLGSRLRPVCFSPASSSRSLDGHRGVHDPSCLARSGRQCRCRLPVCPQAATEASSKVHRPCAHGAAPAPVVPKPGLLVVPSQPAHGSSPRDRAVSPAWSRELPWHRPFERGEPWGARSGGHPVNLHVPASQTPSAELHGGSRPRAGSNPASHFWGC